MKVFERLESEVRSYCRTFTKVFDRGEGAYLYDEDGERYIDFFTGAGALSYGHNHPDLQKPLIDYLSGDGVVHSLDMFTKAKRRFLESFEKIILRPRNLEYKVMFPGPTGTNAVEAALKLCRKITGRTKIVSFTNGFHGMTLGSLAVTGNKGKRAGAGLPLEHAVSMPYDGYLGPDVDAAAVLETYLEDGSSGMDKPAAFIVETVQGEGGVNVAREGWLRKLERLARKHEILLIVDDIQVGCGRTGPFFSFEKAGIVPDIVTLSKSLSGYGLPLAVTLIKPELDRWRPGEHNGTFRGHNPAFVTAAAALERFWADEALSDNVTELGNHARRWLGEKLESLDIEARVRGKGLILGIDFEDPTLASKISKQCFELGMVIETSGSKDQVLKLLPPLVIDRETLNAGLDIIELAVAAVIGKEWNDPRLEKPEEVHA